VSVLMGRPAFVRVAWRALLFSVGFIASASAVWLAASRAVDAAHIDRVALSFVLHDNALAFRKAFVKVRAPQRVAMVGDSTLMFAEGMKAPRIQTLPERVAAALRKYGERGERIAVKTLRVPGLGPPGMYFASDEIIAARPDRIVLALNLRCFTSMRSFSYEESAGFMSVGQLLEALRLPMFAAGLTADRLLFYNALVALGADEVWPLVRQLQGRAFKLREHLANSADAAIGSTANADMQFGLGISRWGRTTISVDNLPRVSLEAANLSLAPIVRGLSAQHSGLRILAAVLARFRRANIPTLVYVEPINVEHLRSIGLPLDQLPGSLRTIQRAVEREGAEFVDFHDILPERAFRDAGDHYTFDGQPNGTFRLASALAAVLIDKVSPESIESADNAVQ
jgi:hypothetical protein